MFINVLAVVGQENIWIADEGGGGVTCDFQSKHVVLLQWEIELLTLAQGFFKKLDCRRDRLCRLPGNMMTLFTDGRFRNSHRDKKLVLMSGWCFTGF